MTPEAPMGATSHETGGARAGGPESKVKKENADAAWPTSRTTSPVLGRVAASGVLACQGQHPALTSKEFDYIDDKINNSNAELSLLQSS